VSWIRIDDDLHDDPRVVEIPPAAYGLLLICLGWAARHLTNGWVSAAVVRQRGGEQATTLSEALTRVGLWAPKPRNEQDGYEVAADIMRWQLTAEQLAERRRQRAEAGRTGGRKSAEGRKKPGAKGLHHVA
jgi:hypothetical protein